MGSVTVLHATSRRRTLMKYRVLGVYVAVLLGLMAQHCSYPHYAGPILPEPEQTEYLQVADDGTVTFSRDRLDISVRPMTDEELNRRFAAQSQSGPKSTNPYTFADADVGKIPGPTPQRFTVFYLSIRNFAYPKVHIDPERIVLRTDNGREYWSLNLQQLTMYFRPYAIGFRGNAYHQYREYVDTLTRTMYRSQDVFSGQEVSGFIVFPALHPDVEGMTLHVLEAHLRFDYRNEPVDSTTVAYRFHREIGRWTPDGIQM